MPSKNMISDRVTVRLPKALAAHLRQRCRKTGQTPSQLVRIALEKLMGGPKAKRSAYDLAMEAGIIGCAKGLPEDLSTNPRYFEGFGESE